MSDVALNILLSAKDMTGGALESVESKMGRLEKTAGLTRAAFGALGGAGTAALVGGLSDAANAAAQDEASVLRLKQAVENSGASWDANVGQINNRIKAGQNMAFTDDQVRDSLALLTAQTGNVDDALKRQTLAMDFARGAGIDLHTASKLLGKVTDENINVFARYGIHVEKGGDATAAFAAIQQKFGGQAKVYGDSTAGSIFKVRDAIDEWREGIGAAFGPATGFIALLPGISSGVTLAGGAIGAMVPALVSLGGTLISTVIPAIIATTISLAPILIPLLLIGAAVAVLALAWSNNWGDIQGKTAAAVEFISPVIGNLVAMVQNIVTVVTTVATAVVGAVGGLFSAIGTAVQTFLGFWDTAWAEFKERPWYYLGVLIGLVATAMPRLVGILIDFAGRAVAVAVQWVQDTGSIASGFFTALPGNVAGWLVGVIGAIAGFAGEARDRFWQWASGIGPLVESGLSNLPSLLWQAGANAVQGFVNGIGSMAGAVWGAVQNIAGNVLGGIQAGLGIQSPSVLMAKIGADTVAGLVVGLTQNASLVDRAATGLADRVKGALGGGMDLSLGVSGGGSMRGAWSGASPPFIGASAAPAATVGAAPQAVVNHIHVEIDGREIAYAVQQVDTMAARRSGITGEALAR